MGWEASALTVEKIEIERNRIAKKKSFQEREDEGKEIVLERGCTIGGKRL